MLFFINHDYNSKLFLELKEAKIWAEKASIKIKELYILYQELQTNIKFLIYRSAFYYNKHHAKAFMLKKRNKVYLL